MKKVSIWLIFITCIYFSFQSYATPKIQDLVLFDAVKKNAFEQTKKALGSFAKDPDICNKNGVTPLMIASYNGFFPVVKLLLHHKANVNQATLNNSDFELGPFLFNKNKSTQALMFAAFAGSIEIVLTLLKAGALVNAQDSDGQTAMVYAILGDKDWPHQPLSQKRKKIIKILLDFGADAHIADKTGQDAAYYYSCVAGLVPSFNNQFEKDQSHAEQDPLYLAMK